MKRTKWIGRRLCLILIVALLLVAPARVLGHADGVSVYVCGYAAGFTINPKGAYIIGVTDVVTDSGVFSPAKDAGIIDGDILLNVGGKEVNSFEDIEGALTSVKSESVIVTLKRGDEVIIKEIKPCKDLAGKRRLGLLVRDKISGIGTVTYVDESGNFMALGHSICGEGGNVIEVSGGELYGCSIFDVLKGERGKAGELRGVFINELSIGEITDNYPVGIRGTVSDKSKISKLSKAEVGDGKIGNASIISTVDGELPKEYSIMIVKVDENEKCNRNYVIKVTDKELLQTTGGIVQGMSGSPIIQDGKIIGAVTHVFVNDPTRGFGIDIDKMLLAS